VLEKVVQLQRTTKVAFASVAMSPLAYIPEAVDFTRRWKQLPFLQGHHASTGAIRALVEFQDAGAAATPELKPHPSRARAMRALKGLRGPLDEVQGAKILELYGVRRPAEATVADPARAAAAGNEIGFPVAVKALAPELPHKAKLGGVRLDLRNAVEVEVAAAEVLQAATRAGAARPKVLVQEMATGAEVLVGAVIDDRFGACITVRPGGALAEAGDAVFVACPLTPKQAQSYVDSQAERCGLDERRHDLKAMAKAVESIARAAHDLGGRLTSLEANPLLVGAKGAVAVDALAEARPE